MSASTVLPDADTPLSPWWVRGLLIVMGVGFALLLTQTVFGYRFAPPVPERIVDANGQTLFTGVDIRDGQAVFLKYGLMDNGSVWGHGAYLGPDYSALALHRIGLDTADAIAERDYHKPVNQLDHADRAAVHAQVAVLLKANRYDPATGTLTLTAPESIAYRQQVGFWTDYMKVSSKNGGLRPGAVSNPTDLRHLTAFIVWTAWASVADRPHGNVSYTTIFPTTRRLETLRRRKPTCGAR